MRLQSWIISLAGLGAIVGTQPALGAVSEFKTIIENGITFSYRVRDAFLDLKVSCPTDGWAGVGFDPTKKMQGANIILGYVDAQGVHVRDDYGTTSRKHEADTSLGGADHVLNATGFEKDRVTTLEFSIPLDSGDSYDTVLIPGKTTTVILGCGKDGGDNFTERHKLDAIVPVVIE